MKTAKAAAIHDLSGIGRCSLTAAIPILSVMGVQVCPLPTAVLSNQTGFAQYDIADLTDHMERFGECWAPWYGQFDAIYTGFLSNPRQAEITRGLVEKLRGEETLVMVDPILGDHGVRYPIFDDTMCEKVRELAFSADVITPNVTEAAVLLDKPADCVPENMQEAKSWVHELCTRYATHTILTGFGDADTVQTLCGQGEQVTVIENPRIGAYYPGTGDLFAAVVLGALLKGHTLPQAAQCAADFVCACIRETVAQHTQPQWGVLLEPQLRRLWNV